MKLIYQTYLIIWALFFSNLMSLAQSRPNVIVIYTDDQGAIDLGSYGASDLYTPNLDKLAKEGTRFTQAYVAAPVCAPSRAALLTGNYPQSAGVKGNTSAAVGSHGMPSEQYTLAELFKDNGYNTGHIGKWHLGMSEETGPNAQGFDYSFGHLRGCIDNYSHFFYWEGPNVHDLFENGEEVFYDGQYFPDLASDRALQFLEDNKDAPFFMYYAINMPHYPYQPTQKWRDYYKDLEMPRRDYNAFISTIDERIGFLVNKLEELGIRENTIIIYQSDNGHSTEVRAFKGGGNAGPYRGAKSSLFEGGIRLPAIISWKDNLPHNVVNDQFFLNTDWMPTLASLCDLNTNLNRINGIDQSEMINNPELKTKRSGAVWKYGTQWAVRRGNWKLMGYPNDTSNKGKLNFEDDALFLSNLSEDVSEMTNLVENYPEIVEELIEVYMKWDHAEESDVPKKTGVNKHLGLNKNIKSSIQLHANYQNLEVLLDGKFGIKDYKSGQWIGQLGKDLEFIVDLDEVRNISSLTLNYLYDDKSWILRPASFKLSYSKDGIEFSSEILTELDKPLEKDKKAVDSEVVKFKNKARFIKIRIDGIDKCPEGYACEGNPAWFFIDEIIIE
jgi:arylsulfatase A-like enzyme